MICIKCGQEFNEGTKFCTKCGYGVADNTAPGKKLLKVTGILLIIFSSFAFITFIALIAFIAFFGTSYLASELGAMSGFTIFLSVLSVPLHLFLGITGVKYCNDIKKAKLLKYFTFGFIGFYIVWSIYAIASINANEPGEPVITIFAIIIGFIIPILYFIGVQKNLKVQETQ